MSERKKLVGIGNSRGVILEAALLEQLGLGPEDDVELDFYRAEGKPPYVVLRAAPRASQGHPRGSAGTPGAAGPRTPAAPGGSSVR